MTIEEVEKWFGNLNRACVALKINRTNANQWRDQGYIPMKQQFFLGIITNGELVPDKKDPSKDSTLIKKPKKLKKERE